MGGFRVCGFDVSPTHGAAVAIDAAGRLLDFVFLAEAAKDVSTRAAQDHGSAFPHLSRKAIPDQEQRDFRRLMPTMRLFLQWRQRLGGAGGDRCYGAIEAYAFRGGSVGAHTKGEIGGLLRLALMQGGWWLRTHDPMSVKLFATGNGDAEKDEVAEGVARKWGPDVLDAIGRWGKGPREDLVDAYVLAQMGLREIQLRSATVQLRDLPEEEIRVFNRVTKAHPVNILARDWICEAGRSRASAQ